jgi:hypothetical protein
MELALLAFGYAAFLFVAVGIAQGSPTWEMEDPPYVNVNLRKPVRKVDRKPLTPLQTPDLAVSDDLGKTKLVSSVMVKTPYYCRDNQSDEEALKMMRELNLPYLPVVDSNLRIVGVVSMRDLMRSKEQKDPPPSGK